MVGGKYGEGMSQEKPGIANVCPSALSLAWCGLRRSSKS